MTASGKAGAVKKAVTSEPRTPPAPDQRHVLCEAARGVFAERGWSRARTRDIADAAGVTETVLYRHFASKQELFEASILEPLEEFIALLKTIAPQMQSVELRGRVVLANQVHVAIQRAMHEMVPLLGVALFSDVEAGKRFYRERLLPEIREAAALVDAAARPETRQAISAEQLLIAMLGMHLAVATQSRLSQEEVDNEALASVLTRFLAFGLPLKPKK